MNQLLLTPNDVLFFRDGRPMGGSLSGHGAAWPLPTVTNAALHAALHRANLESHLGGKLHGHDHHGRDGKTKKDVRKFGSLLTAGPFPIIQQEWLFPRPLDAGTPENSTVTLEPLNRLESASDDISWQEISSLPGPLRYAVANTLTANKILPEPWWNSHAWNAYLGQASTGHARYYKDSDFSDSESTFGIGIDADTGTQNGESFYSAHYLRLKPQTRIGLIAEAFDKIDSNPANKKDLIPHLIQSDQHILVGGQQRLCTTEIEPHQTAPLPCGLDSGFLKVREKYLVKWVLLTPAIFPAIAPCREKNIKAHSGGWLPNWIDEQSGQVMLKAGKTSREEKESRDRWRERVKTMDPIKATLVAALTGKPIPVTGYALPHEIADVKGGPKPTHLAVPAGSVYYFEADDESSAHALANALNWHGDTKGTHIKNRRSTLMGEKGFGLGVCGTWKFHSGKRPQP